MNSSGSICATIRHLNKSVANSATAIVSAGPLFLAGLLLTTAANDPGRSIDAVVAVLHDPDNWLNLISIQLFIVSASSIFGAIIAAVPNIICGAVMIRLGENIGAMRLPVVWALVGAVVAGIPAFAITLGTAQSISVGCAFAFTGAGCALVFRRGVQWDAD